MRLWCGDGDGNGDAVLSNTNCIKGWCPNPGDIYLLTYFAQFLQSLTSRFTIFIFWYANTSKKSRLILHCIHCFDFWGAARFPETATSQLPSHPSEIQEILGFNPHSWSSDPRAAGTGVVMPDCSQGRISVFWVFPSSSSWRIPLWWDSSSSLLHLISVSTSLLLLCFTLAFVFRGFNHSDPNTHPCTSEWASSKTGDQYFRCSGKKRSEWRTHTEERAVIKSDMQSIFERCGFFCHLTLFKKHLGMFLNYILSSLPWFSSRAGWVGVLNGFDLTLEGECYIFKEGCFSSERLISHWS